MADKKIMAYVAHEKILFEVRIWNLNRHILCETHKKILTHVAHEKIEVRMWYLNRHIAEEARMFLCSLNQWQLTGSSKERAGGETKLVWGEGGH